MVLPHYDWNKFLDMNNIFKLILSVIIPVAVGATSGFFTVTGVNSWYQTINIPSWNPPSRIFGPVWTILYVMMGIALFFVWKADIQGEFKKKAITFFAVQLLLNFFWSIIFFDQHQIGWALAEMIVLWIFILFTIFAFARINTAAAWLLVPYISWVSFAAILNYTIWKIN
jgi:translocator protein